MLRLITTAIVLITIIRSSANGEQPDCNKEWRPTSIIYYPNKPQAKFTVYSKEFYTDVNYDLTTGRISHLSESWSKRSVLNGPVIESAQKGKLLFKRSEVCKEGGLDCEHANKTFPQLIKTNFYYAKTATATTGIPGAATTMVYNGRKCRELKCLRQFLYAAFDEQGVTTTDREANEFSTGEAEPSVMSFIEKSGLSGAREIMVYDNYFTEMMLEDLTKRPPKLDVFKPVTHGWKTAGRWLDCPIDLCFEGHFDAADTLDGTKVRLYEGKYQFTIKEPGQGKAAPVAELSSFYEKDSDAVNRNPDAIATVMSTKEVFVFKGSSVIRISDLRQSSTGVERDTIFEELKGKGKVDGAYSHSGHLFVVIGNDRYVFKMNDDKTIKSVGKDKLNSAYKGMPKSIDAAATTVNDVIFFSGTFVMQTKVDGGTVDIKLMQDNLFSCSNHYHGYTRVLGVNDTKDFVTIQDHVKPKADAATDVAAVTITVVPIITTTTMATKDPGGTDRPDQTKAPTGAPGGSKATDASGSDDSISTGLLIGIVIVIIAVFALVAAAAWYFCFRTPATEAQVANPERPPQEQMTPPQPTTSNEAMPNRVPSLPPGQLVLPLEETPMPTEATSEEAAPAAGEVVVPMESEPFIPTNDAPTNGVPSENSTDSSAAST